MKKLDSKGFLLTELLVTATLVSTVLIFLYTQFYTIKRSYDTSFKYNTVNGLYALSNVRSFLEENDIYILTQGLNTTSYIDLKNDNLQTKYFLDYIAVSFLLLILPFLLISFFFIFSFSSGVAK